MNKMQYSSSFVIIILLLISLFSSGYKAMATSWAYPFVVWDGYVYEISDEYVTEIDKKIGKVTKYSDMKSYRGNFSNKYEKGTKYYAIKGIGTDEAIAVEEAEGKYIKAIRDHEYQMRGGSGNWVWIWFILLLGVVAGGILFCRKARN